MAKTRKEPQNTWQAMVLARWLADGAVRNNTPLEGIHGGKTLPKKYMGDYSRITEKEMHELMCAIEKNLWNMLGLILDLRDGKKVEWPAGYFPTYDGLLKTIYRMQFGSRGVSWHMPEKEIARLRQLNKEIQERKNGDS